MAPVHLCVLLVATSCVSQTFSKPLSGGSGRLERSDDPQPLAAVVDNLSSRLASLEASNTALKNQVTALENQLRAKRCESGTVQLYPHAQPPQQVSGETRRPHTVHVNFDLPFPTQPWVVVAITRLDVDNRFNVRINVGADAISTSGFDARAYEWADTNTFSVSVVWVACDI
ncbi:uncharacterized protein LOC112566421 [Pomacea canaliculata]|uniref:uncharacterized protein LOC112566421 n=1 Tax=Pomacea canaliculata TaxID=400727 RepID=UPI000D73D4E0|nr:uncharacterized protein LOC112566421 [Pomacea canaliculata]